MLHFFYKVAITGFFGLGFYAHAYAFDYEIYKSSIINSPEITKNYWNQRLESIKKYTNEDGCRAAKILTPYTFNNEAIHHFWDAAIGCFTYREGKSEHVIKTRSPYNRIFNITKGLATTHNDIVNVGEEYSLVKNINEYRRYKKSDAIFQRNGKVYTKKVAGGGLCGVSTGFYPAVLKNKNLTITERHPHSNYYYAYYGPKIGLDASIYSGITDFRFRNDSDQRLLIKTYTTQKGSLLTYSVQLLQPFTDKDSIQVGKSYRTKSGKTCNTVLTSKDRFSSCYYKVYR